MLDARVYRMLGGVVFALVCAFVFAGQAGADEAAAKPKRIIHGKPENRRAVEALLEESEGDAEAKIDLRYKTVKQLKGKFKIDRDKPVEEAALDFIDRHRNAFGLKDAKRELKLDKKNEHQEGDTYIHYQQMYNGVPIFQKIATVHINREGDVDRMTSGNIPTPDIDTTPLLTEEEALNIVKADLDRMAKGKAEFGIACDSKTTLVINSFDYGHTNNKLTYRVIVCADKPSGDWAYFIDAKNGEILGSKNLVMYDSVQGG